jgi:ankyrin repeat protein
MDAARVGNLPIIRILLKAGADPAARNVYDDDALNYAQNEDFQDCVALIKKWLKQ